jgi:DNA-binding LacI/PurR family transcriptional regulator
MQTKKLSAQRSATLDDIAARAGVNRMAVSVVLNGARSGTRVSQETRQRILEIARDLNYRPNSIARSLSRRATHIFGFYSGYDYFDTRNPFLAELTAGLMDECSRRNRDLLLHAVFRGPVIDDIYDELLSGKIDGLVVWAPPEDPLIALLGQVNLPVVAVVEIMPAFPSVVIDEHAGAFQIVRHLAGRGHRSLLCRTHITEAGSRGRRLNGFRAAAAECGIAFQTLDTNLDLDQELQPLLAAQDHPPTAIACWNDIAAHQTLAHCRRSGIRVPDHLAVTGFDGFETPIEPVLRLTTVRAPWAQVASTAIAYLAELLDGREVPMETTLPVELLPGETA